MTADIISIKDLSYAWPNAIDPTLRSMEWQIQHGEFALLIGRSGSGKSTLLRTLNGLVPHFSGGTFGGSVAVNGLNTRDVPPRGLARHVGFVFQDPEAQLLTSRVVDDIAFSLEQMGVAPATMRKRVEEMLDLVGVAHLRDRDPSTLSGGERQRVAIASALALHPRVLVLDEPTSQLDPWGAEAVIAALTRMNDDLGLTVVLAEHRLERVLSHADTVRLLADDGTPTDGSAQEIAHLVAEVALPPVTRIGRAFGWAHLPLTVKQARQHDGISKLLDTFAGVEPPRVEKPVPGSLVLQMSDVSVTLGRTKVVHNVSLTVREGEFVALMGRNGSGKTTLIRTIMGFLADRTGSITVDGGEVATGHNAPNGIAYVPQRSSSLFFCETLREELEFTANKRGTVIDVEDLLAEVDLAWATDRHPSTLSVGERQRAAIAMVLAGQPKLLLLDEPTRGMDPWHKRQLVTVLRRLQERGLGILMATHDVELAAEFAHTVAMLGDGGIVATGAPEAVLTNSLTYSTQINMLAGGQWLTVDQILKATR